VLKNNCFGRVCLFGWIVFGLWDESFCRSIMFKEAARSARRSFGRTKRSQLAGQEAMTIKTKITAIKVPPGLPVALSRLDMDASFFVASWDMKGWAIEELQEASKLLPDGFDIYIVGMQNCRSLTEAADACMEYLRTQGEFTEFSHLMSGEQKLKTSLAMMAFVRSDLVENGQFSMSSVGMVRDRKLSMMPLLVDHNSVELSTPGNHKSIKDISANGGAISMRFEFFDTNLLFVNVKQSVVGELNEILARVEPESHAHVFMLGDFGDDVIENTDELEQRLFLESFDRIPMRFRNARRMVLTRSQDKAIRKFLVSDLHGHYEIAVGDSTPGAEKPPPPAAFSTFRIHGASGVDMAGLPPPPEIGPEHRPSAMPPPLPEEDNHLVNQDKKPHGRIMDDDDEEEEYKRRESDENRKGSTKSGSKNRNKSVLPDDVPPPPPPKVSMIPPPPPVEEDERLTEKNQQEQQKKEKEEKGDSDKPKPNSGSMVRKALESLALTINAKEEAKKDHGTCIVCDKKIETSSDAFTSMGQKYHKSCVKCTDCGKVINSQFFMVDGKMLCQESYEKLFVQRCGVCGEKADARDHLIKTKNLVFHIDCFHCSVCDEELAELNESRNGIKDTADFVVGDDGRLFCALHGTKYSCAACNKPAVARDAVQVSLGDSSNHQIFHKSCFCCDICKHAISEKGGSYVFSEDRIFCQEDFDDYRKQVEGK